jgi:c-di-GMP-binding flagellar brake protein YcgR
MQPALNSPADAPIHQRRAHKRFDCEKSCLIQRESQTIPATSRNISTGGINLVLSAITTIPVGKVVTLGIEKCAPINAVVRWSEGPVYGLQFLSSVDGHKDLADLMKGLEADNES